MTLKKHFITPFVLPLASFALAIGAGSLLLFLDACCQNEKIAFVDAFFTATSAVCVTGLASVDPFTVFNRTGQVILLILIQLGGIGIITYSSLIFYLLGRRISLRDRVAVEQSLFYNPRFHLGAFLKRMILLLLCFELTAACILYFSEPERIGFFNALFIAVSAFCNAGFAPWADNLVQWQGHWVVSLTVMSMITLGGLGFFVLDDVFICLKMRLLRLASDKLPPNRLAPDSRCPAAHIPDGHSPDSRTPDKGKSKNLRKIFTPHDLAQDSPHLTYYSKLVLKTSLFLVFFGALCIFFAEQGNSAWQGMDFATKSLTALFQSVTSRTAGFASLDQGQLSDVTLLITMILMVIGGSPGSCAGGIKTTSFRILCSNLAAHLRGRNQIVINGRAMDKNTLNKAMLVFSYAILTLIIGTFSLVVTENGFERHHEAAVPFLELFFEAVSAFATVGLSVDLTPSLSTPGKIILCILMFIGKIGPVWLLTTIQQFQSAPAYRYPEFSIPTG